MTARRRSRTAAVALTGDQASRVAELIREELTAIASIEGATIAQEMADYDVLYTLAKDDHQAGVQRLITLLRLAGVTPPKSAGWMARVAEWQTKLVQHVSTDATLRAMRKVEEHLRDRYRELAGELEGLAAETLTEQVKHADVRWHVLTAHIAHRSGLAEEAALLPLPVEEYLAEEKAYACMRCMLDRPGTGRPLRRAEPYIFVCAACHDEVAASFPADLREQMALWPAPLREARVIERALGRASRETAKKDKLMPLAGHAPAPRSSVRGERRASSTPPVAPGRRGPASADSLERAGASPSELAYTDLLFDYRSVRESW